MSFGQPFSPKQTISTDTIWALSADGNGYLWKINMVTGRYSPAGKLPTAEDPPFIEHRLEGNSTWAWGTVAASSQTLYFVQTNTTTGEPGIENVYSLSATNIQLAAGPDPRGQIIKNLHFVCTIPAAVATGSCIGPDKNLYFCAVKFDRSGWKPNGLYRVILASGGFERVGGFKGYSEPNTNPGHNQFSHDIDFAPDGSLVGLGFVTKDFTSSVAEIFSIPGATTITNGTFPFSSWSSGASFTQVWESREGLAFSPRDHTMYVSNIENIEICDPISGFTQVYQPAPDQTVDEIGDIAITVGRRAPTNNRIDFINAAVLQILFGGTNDGNGLFINANGQILRIPPRSPVRQLLYIYAMQRLAESMEPGPVREMMLAAVEKALRTMVKN